MQKEVFATRDMTILVVDDEPRIRDLVRMNLELERYHVEEAGNGREALEKLRDLLPDLIILDVSMPEMDGFEALRHIREVSTVPVIMLTVRQSEADKIHGLDLGADDYLAKPFSPPELLSRIRALLRRSLMAPPARKTTIVVDSDLTIDFSRREVIVRGKHIVLRPTEYRLLYHLVSNAGRLLTHETLLAKVWGHEYRDESHYLRLYITYLRQKLEQDPAHPQYILTERGLGYRFQELGEQV
jgi:two-component system KDP operon response regulator KdpE